MDAVVMVAFLAVWAGAWWWLAKRMGSNGRGWFVRNLAGGSAGLFAGLVLVTICIEAGLIQPASKNAEETIAEASPAVSTTADSQANPRLAAQPEAEAAAPAKTLGLNPDIYAERVNAVLQRLEKPYRVDTSDVTPGEVNDVLKAKLGPHAALVASISKGSGEIIDLTVIGSGDGSPASGLEIMMMASAALSAAAPDADFREVFKQIPAMMEGESKTYGPVKMGAKTMDQLGTWFFASPI